MKKLIAILSITITLASCSTASQVASSQSNSDVSFATFYNELSPYGRWVYSPLYGRVWISNEPGFEPYSTMGHWEYTNYGWMWASDYSWGWAPFHYGRWDYLNNYGWAWVPGYEWAPAWVGWCNYGGYYGWAPLRPGMGANYSFHNMPYNYWRFVQPQYINNRNVYRHFERPVRNAAEMNKATIINNTVADNNNTYIAGPSVNEVERATKKIIQPKQIAFNGERQLSKGQEGNPVSYREQENKEARIQGQQPVLTDKDNIMQKETIQKQPQKKEEEISKQQPAKNNSPEQIPQKKGTGRTKQIQNGNAEKQMEANIQRRTEPDNYRVGQQQTLESLQPKQQAFSQPKNLPKTEGFVQKAARKERKQ